MPKSCRAAKTAACLCPMVMSAATGGTRPPAAAPACKAAAPQAATTTFTLHAPAPAHNPGPARPSPLLAPHTSAHLPASIAFALPVPFQSLPVCRSFRSSARHSGPSARHRPQHGFPESEGLACELAGALLRPWAQPGVSIRQSTSAPGSNRPSGVAGMQRHANHVTWQMCPDTRLANTA